MSINERVALAPCSGAAPRRAYRRSPLLQPQHNAVATAYESQSTAWWLPEVLLGVRAAGGRKQVCSTIILFPRTLPRKKKKRADVDEGRSQHPTNTGVERESGNERPPVERRQGTREK